MQSSLRFLVVLGLFSVTGCPDDPVGEGGTEDDDGSSSTTGDPTTGSPTTVTPGTGSSTGDPTTGDPTTGDPTTGSSSEGSSSSGAADSSSTGSPAAPEIEVTVAGSAVESADTLTVPGTIDVGATVDAVIEISNTGDAPLDIAGIAVSGPGAAHFQLDDGDLAASVAPGESTTATLTFAPTNGGFKQTLVTIDNNDADEDPFEVDVRASTTPNTWREITPKAGPAPRHNIALAQIQPGVLLMFGGRAADGSVLGDTWTFDVESEIWTDVAPATSPAARFSYGMDAAGPDLAVLAGGTTVPGEGGIAQSDTWHFDGADMNWVASMNNGTPPIRHQAAVAGFPGGMFSYGGIDDTPNDAGGLFLYDAGTQTWTMLGVNDPGSRVAAAAAFNGDGVVTLSGGFAFQGGTLATAYNFILDDSSIEQSNEPALAERYAHELVYLRPDLAVTFGGRDAAQAVVSSTFVYELGADTWTDTAPATSPTGRHNYGMAALPGENKLIMFGGLTATGGTASSLDEVWEYVGPLP